MKRFLRLHTIPAVFKKYSDYWSISLIAMGYLVLSLANLSFNAGSTGAVWLPSGFFLSAFLLYKSRMRFVLAVALFTTDFFMRFLAGVQVPAAMMFSLTVLFQSWFSSWLLLRYAEAPFSLGKVRNLMYFLFFSVLLGNAVSSVIAALASYFIQHAFLWTAFSSWYLSSSWGSIIITPLLLSWSSFKSSDWKKMTSRQFYEGLFLLGSLVVVSYIFHTYLRNGNHLLTLLDYFLFPFLIWAALRFSIRGVTLSSFLLSFIILGAMSLDSSNESASQIWDSGFLIKVNLAAVSVITLFMASVVFELKQGNAALVEREQDLLLAKQKAEEASRFKSLLLLNISHELRTPLNGILGFSGLLSEILENKEHKSMAKDISLSGKRLLYTLSTMMEFSKVESENLHPEFIVADISALIAPVLRQYEGTLSDKNLNLETSIRPGISAFIDPGLFSNSLSYLLDNAIKFTTEGSITVKVDREDADGCSYASVMISDTGIGIPKEQIKTIFDPFRQGNEGLSRSYEGAGLGLTLCRKFVTLMNGEIRVESQPGKSSTFTLLFPLAEPETKTPELPFPVA